MAQGFRSTCRNGPGPTPGRTRNRPGHLTGAVGLLAWRRLGQGLSAPATAASWIEARMPDSLDHTRHPLAGVS